MRRFTLFSLLLVVSQTIFWAQDKSTTPNKPQDSSKAMVYVYRYKQFVGSALAPSVYSDDVQLARMENGRYFTATVDPASTSSALTTSSRVSCCKPWQVSNTSSVSTSRLDS